MFDLSTKVNESYSFLIPKNVVFISETLIFHTIPYSLVLNKISERVFSFMKFLTEYSATILLHGIVDYSDINVKY